MERSRKRNEYTKRPSKVLVTVTRDRISYLPSKAVEGILGRLPIEDAVKTSALSNCWRYKWAALVTKLMFDQRFCDYLEKKSLLLSDFVRTITNLVLLHNGPILGFVLYIPNLDIPRREDIYYLILSILGKRTVKEFTLENSYPLLHKLPSYFYSCTQLTNLKLCKCAINPPFTFRGFPNIITLEFHEVTFAEGSFQYFCSSCPLLERLTLEFCTGSDRINICAPSLKHLLVNGVLKSLSINAENLITLSVCPSSYMAINPKIRETNMIKALGMLPRVERLYLGRNVLQFLVAGGAPKRLPTTFDCLKNLTISGLEFGNSDEISCALFLIRSAPNMQELEILAGLTFGGVMEPVSIFVKEGCTMNCLQIVKFCSINGSRPELELVKSLLACSPSLEKMFIKASVLVDANVGSKMTKELMRFRRASPKAEILYSHPSEDLLAE